MLAERGLSVTVEEIAAAAGVGRRTVFRYFATRDLLLTSAMEDWLAEYVTRLPVGPTPGQEPREWLAALANEAQVLNDEVGEFFWELHGRRSPLAAVSPAVFEAVAAARYELTAATSAAAWIAFGGTGDAPRWVVDTFATQLSVFTTVNLRGFGRTPEEIADVIAVTLEAMIKRALSESNR